MCSIACLQNSAGSPKDSPKRSIVDASGHLLPGVPKRHTAFNLDEGDEELIARWPQVKMRKFACAIVSQWVESVLICEGSH